MLTHFGPFIIMFRTGFLFYTGPFLTSVGGERSLSAKGPNGLERASYILKLANTIAPKTKIKLNKKHSKYVFKLLKA